MVRLSESIIISNIQDDAISIMFMDCDIYFAMYMLYHYLLCTCIFNMHPYNIVYIHTVFVTQSPYQHTHILQYWDINVHVSVTLISIYTCNELGGRPAPAGFRRDRRRLIRFSQRTTDTLRGWYIMI